ncbi:MAG: 30S ribosomal protein S2 [Verrucomicrobiia bacterium]
MNIGIKELLEAGVHFGHQTRRWNPKMKRFIFDSRNGIHIIDLTQTLQQLTEVCEHLGNIVRNGGNVLFVGTKKQAQQAIKDAAISCGQPYVTERWLGGTLTNMKTVRRSIGRMNEIEKMFEDGSINQFGKKEQSSLNRQRERLVRNLGGIREMTKFPEAIFIVDVKREHNAVAEARRLKIPLIAIADTNCNPDYVDMPIAGNDDAIRSIRLLLSVITEAVTQARAEYEAKYAAKKKAEEEAAAAETPTEETPTEETPTAETPTAETPTAETPAAEAPAPAAPAPAAPAPAAAPAAEAPAAVATDDKAPAAA